MKFACKLFRPFLFLGVFLLLLPAFTFAQQYQQTNLVSDIMGMAPTFDKNLKNPWGITRSPAGSPWWVANNNSGTSTLYDGTGAIIPINKTGIVIIPPPAFRPGTQSAPTGIVYNGSATDFPATPGGPGARHPPAVRGDALRPCVRTGLGGIFLPRRSRSSLVL